MKAEYKSTMIRFYGNNFYKEGQWSIKVTGGRKRNNIAVSKVQWHMRGRKKSGSVGQFCNTVDKINNLKLVQELWWKGNGLK